MKVFFARNVTVTSKAHCDYLGLFLTNLRLFLATESPLNIMKNTFCFTSKALFVFKIFKFFS